MNANREVNEDEDLHLGRSVIDPPGRPFVFRGSAIRAGIACNDA